LVAFAFLVVSFFLMEKRQDSTENRVFIRIGLKLSLQVLACAKRVLHRI
jgi:hypothetical protein